MTDYSKYEAFNAGIEVGREESAEEVARLRSALAELADLMDAVRDGSYTPDSFTTQPARAALAVLEEAKP